MGIKMIVAVAALLLARTSIAAVSTATDSDMDIVIENDNVRAALTAYQDYIDENVSFGKELADMGVAPNICALIYLDDDEIPECCVMGYWGAYYLLRYRDGEVLDYYPGLGSNHCKYQEKTGRFCYICLPGSNTTYIFLELSDNEEGFLETGSANYWREGKRSEYSTDGENANETAYEDYIASFGTYESMPELSETVMDAYKDLLER
ncbi:MAG: hypothetical protein K2J04_06785 [Lachnospiraceae bacterium]|nr:hypothetical protein [Lachnospiraceae bacterium]